MSCEICGGEQTGEHDWDDGVVTQPSCEEKGTKTYTCQTCSHTKTEEIPAKEHQYESTVIQAPTCTTAGQIHDVCSVCQTEQYRDMPIDPDAHDWGEWSVSKGPDIGMAGEEQRICRWNAEHVQTRGIDPIPCRHICASCNGCTDSNCPGAPKCSCNKPDILPFIPLNDTAISYIPEQPLNVPAGQTVSIVATEVQLSSASDNAVSQPAANVNPYEEFILNNAEGMKVETVFEIGLVVNETGAAYELKDGESAQVRLFVGPENAQAIEEGKMFLIHITDGIRATYGAEEIVAEKDGETYTGYITFNTDTFSPFVLVSLPDGLKITLDGKVESGKCTASIHANQAYRCNLFIAIYDADGKMLAVQVVDSCNLAANPLFTLEFTGAASYVKAFMMEADGSLAPRCTSVTDDKLND